jgi:hypothetical protein
MLMAEVTHWGPPPRLHPPHHPPLRPRRPPAGHLTGAAVAVLAVARTRMAPMRLRAGSTTHSTSSRRGAPVHIGTRRMIRRRRRQRGICSALTTRSTLGPPRVAIIWCQVRLSSLFVSLGSDALRPVLG